MCVTIGGEDLEDTATEVQDRDIERTTTKVEYSDVHILILLVDTVGQGGSRRLVDDTADVQSGDGTSLLGSLTLRVGEVCRNGDDGVGNLLTEEVLSGLLHLLQYHGRDLLRGVLAVTNLYLWIAVVVDDSIRHAVHFLLALLIGLTHETLDGVNGVVRVGDSLTLCRVTNLTLTALDEADDGRCSALAFRVCDNCRFVALEYGNTTVSCT